MKETTVEDNNLRRGQPLALAVAQTCLCKLQTEREQGPLHTNFHVICSCI